MEIYVEPARRPGKRKLIRRSSLSPAEIDPENGGIRLTLEAEGIYDKSTYRYTLKLSPETLATMFVVWNDLRGNARQHCRDAFLG